MSEVKSLLYVPLDDRVCDEKNLPLHVTLLPPVRHEDARAQELDSIIADVAKRTDPIEMIGLDDDYFGNEEQIRLKQIPVRRIGSPALVALHAEILTKVLEAGFSVNSEFAGQKYSPHSTYIGGEGLR